MLCSARQKITYDVMGKTVAPCHDTRMTTHHIREWRKVRGLTQAQLAEAVGLTETSINRIENGKQRLTETNLAAIARALDCAPGALYNDPPEGTRALREDEAGQVGSISIKKPRTQADGLVTTGLVGDRVDLPIYASAQGGKKGMVISYDPIDWVKRPEPLFNVDSGFGMYVVGESMEPAYRQGDMILVHPNRPANPGDDVLVVKKDGSEEYEALIKTLLSANGDDIRLKQYNPADEFTVPKTEIHAIYLIVGKYHRR